MLISQTGTNNGKSISFAHLHLTLLRQDLPILKVLGWDSDDTGLKVDYVRKHREKLVWPDDQYSDAWNPSGEAFALKNREVIQSSKEMAERLGHLALAVRHDCANCLPLRARRSHSKLMSVFKENLISDLDSDKFSDMYSDNSGLTRSRINPRQIRWMRPPRYK